MLEALLPGVCVPVCAVLLSRVDPDMGGCGHRKVLVEDLNVLFLGPGTGTVP